MRHRLALLALAALVAAGGYAFFAVGPGAPASRATTAALEPGSLAVLVEVDGARAPDLAPLLAELDALAAAWHGSPEGAAAATLEASYGEARSLFARRAHAHAAYRLPPDLDGAGARQQVLLLLARRFATETERAGTRIQLRWRPPTPADALHQRYALVWDGGGAWRLVDAQG